jgi:hypothetical protein
VSVLTADEMKRLRAPQGPGLGIEANEALGDEALIRAYAEG